MICREEHPLAAGGITATYTRISEGLTIGIRAAGVDAELARASDPTVPLRDRQATLPCFGSTTRAEIVVDGRKLVGSAQHRMRGLMIQHGSILVGPTHRELIRYLNASDEVRERYARRIEASTTSLRESGWRGGDDDETEALIDALANGMRSVLGSKLTSAPLGAAERGDTERLAEEKYSADWWNMPAPGIRPARL